jgi:penicillin amidase
VFVRAADRAWLWRARLGLAGRLLLRLAGSPSGRRPPGSREVRLVGLGADAAIRRDEHGIPHLSASARPDLFFAQGFAAAEDRLWQMDFLRRAAAGRLAEILGDPPVGGRGMPAPLAHLSLARLDLFYRALGMQRVGERCVALAGPAARAALEAYAAGVNAARALMLDGARLPCEFALLGYRPEPWAPADCLGIGRFLGFLLSLAWQADLVMELLRARPVLRRFQPRYPAAGPNIVEDRAGPAPRPRPEPRGAALDGLFGPGAGSNCWAVAGERSATGKPLLANDPHLPVGLPPFLSQVSLAGAGLDVIGATVPGLPGVLVGFNGFAAWGLTNAMIDDVDYYAERLDAAGERVRRPGGWEPLVIREEVIAVRGARAPVRARLRFVARGEAWCPLASDVMDTGVERELSMRWTGLEATRDLDAILGIDAAGTFEEFQAALADFAVPAQNVVYADRAGRLAYFLAGRVPIRAGGADGSRIFDGAAGEGEWVGAIPFAAMPRAVDPPGGSLVTANHRVAPEPDAARLSYLWEPPHRATRIGERLAAVAAHTPESFAAIHRDVGSLHARGLLDGLLRPLAARLRRPRARQAARLLLAWDGAHEADSAAAALFHAAYDALLSRAVAGPLEAARPGLGARYLSLLHLPVVAVDALLSDRSSDDGAEARVALLEASLEEAWSRLAAALGPDPGRWRWGDLHRLTLRHALGRGRRWPARLVTRALRLNRGPFVQGGDGFTVNLTAYPLRDPFATVIAAGYRQVVDLAHPERSGWVVPGGASGDPLSPHYADQLEAWRAGTLIPMRRPGPGEERAGADR